MTGARKDSFAKSPFMREIELSRAPWRNWIVEKLRHRRLAFFSRRYNGAGEVVIKAEANDGSFHLSVRDTGPGISAADQTKLFQEFQQADNAITRKKGGTVSKRIIEMHGGRIWVNSIVGQGSTFSFMLPVRVEQQAQPT